MALPWFLGPTQGVFGWLLRVEGPSICRQPPQGQRAHMGCLGKIGRFARCDAFGYILLSLDGWNRKEKQLGE